MAFDIQVNNKNMVKFCLEIMSFSNFQAISRVLCLIKVKVIFIYFCEDLQLILSLLGTGLINTNPTYKALKEWSIYALIDKHNVQNWHQFIYK